MPLSALWERLRGRPPLDALPYEELLRHDPDDRKRVFDELVRRLSGIVFLAAMDFCRRYGVAEAQEAETLTTAAFEAFLPEMDAGRPELVLRRFAATLRSVLDDEALGTIERLYYRQLLLHHLPDRTQRQCLHALFASGLAAAPPEIAARLLLPVEQVEQALAAGSREMERVMREDFKPRELREMTAGVLPCPILGAEP